MEIKLGHDADARLVVWDTEKDPHLTISGVVGSGMSVLARNISYEAIAQHADVFILDDSKNGSDYHNLIGMTDNMAFSEDAVLDMLHYIVRIIKNRFEVKDPSTFTPIVVIYDYYLISTTLESTKRWQEDSPANEDRREKRALVEWILRHGRYAKVSMVLISSHFVASNIGTLLPMMGSVLLGHNTQRVRDYIIGPNIPDIEVKGYVHGHGLFRSVDGVMEFQAPYRA